LLKETSPVRVGRGKKGLLETQNPKKVNRREYPPEEGEGV